MVIAKFTAKYFRARTVTLKKTVLYILILRRAFSLPLLPLLLCLIVVTKAYGDETLYLGTAAKPPLSNAGQTGLLDLVAKEAFRRVGCRIVIHQLPAERSLMNANEGIDDGELSRISGLRAIYPDLVEVPEKTMDLEFTAFSRNVKIKTMHWDTLKPYSIGFITGWKILEKNVLDPGFLVKVKNEALLFQLLATGRADIVIYDRLEGLRVIQEMGYEDVHVLQPPLTVRSLHIYLHKKHRALVPLVNQALKEMKADGTYNRIVNQTLQPLNAQMMP